MLYEGDIKDGKSSGKGAYVYAWGGKYQGDWFGNKFHGLIN